MCCTIQIKFKYIFLSEKTCYKYYINIKEKPQNMGHNFHGTKPQRLIDMTHLHSNWVICRTFEHFF